jgi:membrane-associated phospholipid phosphatase
MNNKLAQFLSVVLHPVLMPTYALLMIFRLNSYVAYTTSHQAQAALYSVIIFNTLVMPVVISYLLFSKGYIKSFEMQRRQERIIPFIANAVLLLVAYYMIRQIVLPKIFYLLILGATAAVVIAILINLKWKISIHMIGIGGIIGMLFGMASFLFIDLSLPILISIFVAGILGTARLSLGAHHPLEIYGGFFVGFFCEYFLLSI